MHRLWVEMAPDHNVGVFHARREYADAHLTRTRGRQVRLDYLQPFGTAEAPHLNNSIAQCVHDGSLPADLVCCWAGAAHPMAAIRTSSAARPGRRSPTMNSMPN